VRIAIKKIAEFTGHRGSVYALQALDQFRFLSGGSDGMIAEWNIKHPGSGKWLADAGESMFCTAVSHQGAHLIAGHISGTVSVINLKEKKPVKKIQTGSGSIYDLLFPGNEFLAATASGELLCFREGSYELSKRVKVSGAQLRCLVQNTECERIFVSGSDTVIRSLDSGLRIKSELHGHHNSVFALAFLPELGLLLSGGRDAQLRFWSVQSLHLQHTVAAHLGTINHIAVNNRFKLFATASRDKTVKIWDAVSLELLKVISAEKGAGHRHSVNRLLWLDEQFLLSAGDDRTILAWEVET
jgi:WD40 repeat protein